MVKPESVFCRLLEIQYNTLDRSVETALYLPLRVLREVKSNFSRVQNIIVNEVDSQLDFYEALLIETLILGRLSTIQGFSNFCQVAYSCRALVNLLVSPSTPYLDFVSPSVKAQLSANYDLFEANVCNLGIKRIVDVFSQEVLQDIIDAVTLLREQLEDELRLDEMEEKYLEALNSSGILTLMDSLENYVNCGFSICNFAVTSSNRIEEVADKLSLSVSGTSWTPDFDSMLEDYYVVRERMYTRIDEIIAGANSRVYKSVNRGLSMDELMHY
jgi:hypothetical protein